MEEQSNADYIYRDGGVRQGGHTVRGVRIVEVDACVTFIENFAFEDRVDLRCIRIPNTITTISDGIFSNGVLVSVTLPPSVTTIRGCAFCNCTSLISVTLPPSLTTINSNIFSGCRSLVSVSLPPFTTTIGTRSSPDWFDKFLVKAGFSEENPNDLLSGQSMHKYGSYYNLNTWARTIGTDGQLPLITAARKSVKWNKMQQIFTANMPVINEIDALSGLPLFLLAATGPTSDLESVYNLLKELPGAFRFNRAQSS